ncbi:Valyl-tRNA synthetase [Liberibacter crescens BT-1]|uniref:Valine--tRNA ligase n=1 Tax=Liberibacter crescens (strain BT-1) TaxID=1215343 RepID=L0EVS7_LIBCB|nr:valine--tRNA ligase [Liberibacter crescens]AGA64960.1 Valyl-tRNA synthetase [Liberibacter crescens BT-1]AMC12980.1 valyl-tRNA synthetase [Liberibacter crescens]
MLNKTYDCSSIEQRIACKWEKAEAFRAGVNSSPEAESFSIVIPPPNVTGSLHMGHALNSVLQDILVRFERMRGKNVLWQPGTDHAGIATQIVVERHMSSQNLPSRLQIGREAFIKKVWEWKEESGSSILTQLRRLGASCDWSRERFTMDQGMSEAVIEAFVTLYKQGFIYKDNRLVNWDPKLETSISDLEVDQVEVNGNLWYFRYFFDSELSYRFPTNLDEKGNPIAWDTRNYITIATTRPETIFGDTAIVVNPNDKRYKDLIGKFVNVPIIGRRIPILADHYPDPNFGAGAVKVTPAHDFNDFEIAKRLGLGLINVFTIQGKLDLLNNKDFLHGLQLSDEQRHLLEELDGLDRFEARLKVLNILEKQNFLDKIEPYKHTVPHCERTGIPVEPRMTEQWYVDAKRLAEPAIDCVKNSETVFFPKHWEKNYYEWLNNIQPWCISRQLWWGHQIPAWYGPDGKIFVEKTKSEVLSSAIEYYLAHGDREVKSYVEDLIQNNSTQDLLKQDEDVLDTWFSSALWPFASLGWPKKTVDLETYYPTRVLITAFDILFFWVARMMMMGVHFIKDSTGKGIVPFHVVYIHALVRDKSGQKMSKSKGNVIDPVGLIDQYGSDALRFTLAIMAIQGRDIKLDSNRIVGYRNFATKIWNAFRFAELNDIKGSNHFDPDSISFMINKWIISRLSCIIKEVTTSIENQHFNEAASVLYRFIWSEVCDWYLEFLKPLLKIEDVELKSETASCFYYTLQQICKLLHPFMPFITEELYSNFFFEKEEKDLLCHAEWPSLIYGDDIAVKEINWLIHLISEIRSVRKEMNVPSKAITSLVVVGENQSIKERLMRHQALICRLAQVQDLIFSKEIPKYSAQIILDEAIFFLPLKGLVDFIVEKDRLHKALLKVNSNFDRIKDKLSNQKFIENAQTEIVEAEYEKLSEIEKRKLSLELAISRIKNL